jgi:hypothetical protein
MLIMFFFVYAVVRRHLLYVWRGVFLQPKRWTCRNDALKVADMAKTGRPTKRSDETDAEILDCLRLGMSRSSAAKYAKIDHETLSRWIKRDATFALECGRASAEFERELVQAARDGVAKSPKVAIDLLERRCPSWNKDNTSQVAANGRNTIAPALVIALMQAPETNAKRTPATQVIDVQ